MKKNYIPEVMIPMHSSMPGREIIQSEGCKTFKRLSQYYYWETKFADQSWQNG
ncbi:MAG: hypothetical protein JSR33_05920 [Proteobacteria bacterium]|nr:hypothetical protein [Pseudomonadota bacterium]